MDKVLAAIQQLLETAKAQSGSPLANIERVYLGDPKTIASSDQPALIVTPVSSDYIARWTVYDQKNFIVNVILVVDTKLFFGSQAGTPIAISAGSWLAGVATITAVWNTYEIGDDITIYGVDPDGYNGTFKVTGVSGDDFTIDLPVDPTTYVIGWFARKDDVQKVFAVADIVKTVEQTWAGTLQTDTDSICGVIQSNPRLPYNWVDTCAYCNVQGVTYQFSSDRGSNTYETIIGVLVQQIANRK